MTFRRLLLPLLGVLAASGVGCAAGSRPEAERPRIDVGRTRKAPATFGKAPTDEGWLRTPPPPFPPRANPEPVVVERWLSNGTRVLASEKHDFPSVGLAFVLDRGTCDGGAAAAIYMSALGSSPDQDRYENYSYLESVAVTPRFTVTEDSVILAASVFPSLLASAISRLAPMFFAPSLTATDLEYSRQRWNGLLSTAGSRSSRLAERGLREALFGGGAYGFTLVDPSEIAAEPDARVREFRKAASSPRHLSVVVVGDTSAAIAVALLERYTKDLPRGEVGTSACAALPAPPISSEIRIIDDPGAPQSKVRIGVVGVPVGHVDGPALDVLSSALGASLSSRLNIKIREEHGFTYGVSMRSLQLRAHGLIEVGTSVETDRTADAIKGLLSELDRAAVEPLDQGELARARTNALADQGAHDNAVEALAEIASYGLRPDALALRSRAISNVTSEQLTTVAGRYLASPRRVITIVGDASRIAGPLEQLGIGKVVVQKR